MKRGLLQYKTLILLVVSILVVFFVRTLLAVYYEMPTLSDLFNTIAVLGSLVVLFNSYRPLKRADCILALALGSVVGAGMLFSTLFSPFPFFGLVEGNPGQAWIRGVYTMVAALGGLVIMRQGGPIRFHSADVEWRLSLRSFVVGLGLGLPLAILNVIALRLTEGASISWQNPWAALLDALQPGIVEEIIYRFALWGLFWLLLRGSLRGGAVWISGLLALLIHTYAHFDTLFMQSPLVALGMGLVIAIIWGLPPTLLAPRRGMEAAIAFHWLQDVARFISGF